MSISVERFGSDGVFATFDSHALRTVPLQMFKVQCRGCGFELPDEAGAGDKCPKCGGRFERVPRPRSLLAAALGASPRAKVG
jgi:predicted RNA-binding Zn-ribbon protein involved in translation (DUF1610 family)